MGISAMPSMPGVWLSRPIPTSFVGDFAHRRSRKVTNHVSWAPPGPDFWTWRLLESEGITVTVFHGAFLIARLLGPGGEGRRPRGWA